MTQPAIKVEGLWKEYVVGHAQQRHGTFYDLLAHSLKAPLNRLRKLGGQAEESERFWALQDVNFEVQPGEVVGVIGRNGAGKSTLLKILSRITAPSKGRIEVRGRLASLLEVGTGFHPELSGRENIFLNGAILGMTRREVARKFDEIVAFAEIEKFIDTPVKRYSSGMYVRLAFAVAAHLDADVLLVDEVLAVGDTEFQKRCLGKMGEVSKGGRTVLFVSHNMEAIQMLCPKGVWLDAGKIESFGETGQVIKSYLTKSGGETGVVQFQSGALALVEAVGTYLFKNSKEVEINISLCFECSVEISDLLLDFELANKRGVRVMQIIPMVRGEPPLAMAVGNRVQYLIKMVITPLAPGDYHGTIYAYSKLNGVILFQTLIPLFNVPPSQGTPECMSDGFVSVLAPEYEKKIVLVA